MSFISHRTVLGQNLGGRKKVLLINLCIAALFKDLFYSFVLNHYSHSLMLCKLMDFKNPVLGYDTALLNDVITTA